MIDYLLHFDSEAAAHTALDPLGLGGVNALTGEPSWDGSRCIPGCRVYIPGDPDQVLSGFWFALGLAQERPEFAALDAALRALPDEACRLIADREAANAGAPREVFQLYVAPSVAPEVLAHARIEPMFMGANYPFGS